MSGVEMSVDGTTAPSDRSKIRRVPHRGSYERETINEILDDGWIAHVATIRDGFPVVVPTYYVRDGDKLLLHGAPAAGFVRKGLSMPVSVAVTHLDGFVFARSAFHHSMNYRSVVVHGEMREVTGPAAKSAALDLFVERMVPGRMADLRPTSLKELRGTSVMALDLAEASAKVRSGGPVDDEDDYRLAIWAGVVPVTSVRSAPVDDDRLVKGVEVPDSIVAFSKE